MVFAFALKTRSAEELPPTAINEASTNFVAKQACLLQIKDRL
jgi:hypothetical protein